MRTCRVDIRLIIVVFALLAKPDRVLENKKTIEEGTCSRQSEAYTLHSDKSILN